MNALELSLNLYTPSKQAMHFLLSDSSTFSTLLFSSSDACFGEGLIEKINKLYSNQCKNYSNYLAFHFANYFCRFLQFNC